MRKQILSMNSMKQTQKTLEQPSAAKKAWKKPEIKATLEIKETLGAAMTGPDAGGQKGMPGS